MLRRLLSRQDGITLVMSVGILGMLSFTGATLIYYSTTNTRSAEYSIENSSAYDLAEAGIDEMMAVLSKPENNALKPDLLPQTTHTYDGGTVTWSGTLDQLSQTWSITSTGRIDNPTGASADVTRTLSAKVPVTPTVTQPLNNPSWNYIFSTRTGTAGGCDQTLYNNVSGGSRMYVMGNLCLENNANITSSPLVVKGNVDIKNNGYIGSSSNMNSRVETYVGGNCRYSNGSWATPCSGNQDSRKIYSKKDPPSYVVGVNTSPILLSPPAADYDAWYENAIPGPTTNCTSANGARSGTPPTFDNDGVRNNSLGVFELTASSSYTCRVGPAGSPAGEISWNASSKVLTVSGTIFIDGSLKITNDATNQYNGQATVYFSGTFLMDNNAKMCGGVSGGQCSFSAWDPNTEMLSLVANGSGGQAGTGNSMKFANNNQFQGALFATAAIALENNVKTDGPMVASHVIMNNNVTSDPFPFITTVPAGMPGNPTVYAQPNAPQLYSG